MTVSDVFADLIESFAMPCAGVRRVCLAFEPLTRPCAVPRLQQVRLAWPTYLQIYLSCLQRHAYACVSSPSVSSGQDLVLQGGNSGDFGSARLVLTCLCIPPAIFVWSTTPRESVRMFGVPVRLLSSTRSCVGHLSGGLGCFTVFRCALMDSFASAVVSVLLRLPGPSLCPLNASDQLARPSGPASTSDFASVPSLSSIVVISPVFNTVEASAWHFDLFIWPLDSSIHLTPGILNLVHSHRPSRCCLSVDLSACTSRTKVYKIILR